MIETNIYKLKLITQQETELIRDKYFKKSKVNIKYLSLAKYMILSPRSNTKHFIKKISELYSNDELSIRHINVLFDIYSDSKTHNNQLYHLIKEYSIENLNNDESTIKRIDKPTHKRNRITSRRILV